MNEQRVFESVWDAIAATPAEAEDLRLRSKLMWELNTVIKAKGWSTEEVARRCGLTAPHAEALIRGRIGLFLLDALVSIATTLGLRLSLEVSEGPPAGGVTGSLGRLG